MGDEAVDGPASEAEWRAGIRVMEGALGIRKHPLLKRKLEVFLPAV